MKRVLVIDIGGSHVKMMISRHERVKFESGPDMTPRQFAARVKPNIGDWDFDAVTIGFPAPVRDGKILVDPKHLGGGWTRFDFRKALGRPSRVINDAALQALGSYRGGRMLFVGLGTGVGSALVWENHVLSLELSDLPYEHRKSLEARFGEAGMKKLGTRDWAEEFSYVIVELKRAMIADYVVLGGGNAKLVRPLPDGIELGHNRNVYLGGVRLWQTAGATRRAKWTIV
ncbi:MAG: ROK family protein [Chthoniobacterales bacterium]